MYRASNRDDLTRLASDVLSVPEPNRPALAAAINAAGLMVVRPWWVRYSVRLVQLRHWCSLYDAYLRFYSVPLPNAPQVVQQALDETARHIRFGHDREDKDSVGGFSQREIDFLTTVLGKVS